MEAFRIGSMQSTASSDEVNSVVRNNQLKISSKFERPEYLQLMPRTLLYGRPSASALVTLPGQWVYRLIRRRTILFLSAQTAFQSIPVKNHTDSDALMGKSRMMTLFAYFIIPELRHLH